jgi:hypothetical protein
MSQGRLWICASVFAASLAYPITASAGIGEIILQMSGPRMLGVGLECRMVFSGTREPCKVSSPATAVFFAENQPDVKMWLSLGGGFYWSLNKTVDGQDYDTGEVKMWSFDPMLEIESKAWPIENKNLKLQIYHGVLGVSYNLLHGDAFPTFSNAALRLRPAGIVIPFSTNWGVDFSYNVRLYPRGFTPEDFGKVALPDTEPNRGEAVHSFVIGFRRKIM